MKRILPLMLLLVMTTLVFPGKHGVLKEVLKPQMMTVHAGKLFVVEGATVLVYSLKDLNLTAKFGRRGEGPGELKYSPVRNNILGIFPGYLFLDGIDKVVFYSMDGKLKKEMKKDIGYFSALPLGNGFAAFKRKRGRNGKNLASVVLCDEGMKQMAELQSQVYPTQGVLTDVIPDALNYCVYNNKIFIEDSSKGFFIGVYDSRGKELYHIEKEYEKIEVTVEHKKIAVNKLAEDPETKAAGGWEKLRKILEIKVPEFLPPIREMGVKDGKIYIQTYKKKGDKNEFIIMGLEGKILKTVFLPSAHPVLYDDEINGRLDKFYSFDGEKYYYLRENEETEEWEIYKEDLK